MTIIEFIIYTTLGFLWCISPMVQNTIQDCYEDDNEE